MEAVYAYLAGVVDVEGEIFITRRVPNRSPVDGREMAYYVPTIELSHTSPILPDLLQVHFPARRLQFRSKNPKDAGWHWWWAENQHAKTPLIRLLPYLLLQRRRAELTLALIEVQSSGKSRYFTVEQRQAMHSLYEELLVLAPRRRRKYRVTAPQPTGG